MYGKLYEILFCKLHKDWLASLKIDLANIYTRSMNLFFTKAACKHRKTKKPKTQNSALKHGMLLCRVQCMPQRDSALAAPSFPNVCRDWGALAGLFGAFI